MKKTYQTFVGIDVSKEKLDYCIVVDPGAKDHLYGIVPNNEKGIKKLVALLTKKQGNVLVCMENTGVYGMPACYWLQACRMDFWVENGLRIKRAKGISRGKSDKADARDIALYAISHLHQLKLAMLPEADLLELRLLLGEREKLTKAIAMFRATGEGKGFLPKEVLKAALVLNKKTIAALQGQLAAIEKLVQEIIDGNKIFAAQEKLLLTVPGIGRQTAANLISFTHAFTSFSNWRQFACYCGVAPFEFSSGSSIKGKTKVSSLANKKLKSLLNMAALAAKKHDTEMKAYFDRKVKEGKNKMLVLNAVRCKVVSRAFAVIERNTPFVNIQKFKKTA